MGIIRMFVMDCDKCGQELTDRDGIYTAGREGLVFEHADMAGWKFINDGWYCGVCLIVKAATPSAEPTK